MQSSGSIVCESWYQWRIQDFPEGGAPTPKSAIILQIFCQKLHENERIWTPGRGGGRASLASPLLDTIGGSNGER